MFCSNCGKKIKDNWNVCPACGIVIEKKDSINSSNASVTNMETQKIKKAKNKKPIYKKIWFWILILFVGFLLIPTGSDETENEVPITLEEAGGFSVWEENGFQGLVRTDIIVNLPVVARDVNNYGVTIGALAIDNIVVVQENNAPVNEWEWLMNAKPYLKDGDKAYFKATLKYANMNTEDEYNYPVFIISDIEAYPAYEENEILEGNLSEEEIENEEIEIEEVHETKNVDYEYIYGGILDSIPSGLSYTFYDIDKDGYQECFAQQGTCNADMIFEIYTTDGKSTAKLGEILGADTTLYECKNKNGFYTYYARGDYELVEYVYIDDGSLKIETVAEDDTYSNITSPEVQHPLSMNNVSNKISVEYDESTPLGKLKKCAYINGCNSKTEVYNDVLTQMCDDGSYYDEVILGAWYDEQGNPLADLPPSALNRATVLFGLDDFYFIDGENYTMDMLKRTSPEDLNTYAMVLTNISRGTDYTGNSYFQGWDYISKEPVIVYGNFNGLLNGDNLLVFAKYRGLATDDTPNFNGFFIEFINNRNIF